MSKWVNYGLIILTEPPYPETLILPKVVGQPYFNLLGELKNIYVKIPLLQALQDVPIYAKTVQDLCTRKPQSPFEPGKAESCHKTKASSFE